MRALCFSDFGGPEVLEYREVPDPPVGEGEALIRTRAIGLNFADVYRRRGNYHLTGTPPWIAGYEAAGEIVEAPPGSGLVAGQRVAFADSPHANAELVAVAVDRLVPLPDDVGFDTAAALLLQGMTAQYLVRDSHRLQRGETTLVHSAAGGVGGLLSQIARRIGARVLGVTSSPAKRERALAAGADAVALYDEDWVARARAFGAEGAGVDVAFDAVGSTLLDSLDAVRTGGHVVFYGMAGGEPPPVPPRLLMDTSKSLTGGDLWNVLRTATDRRTRADELFEWVRAGALAVEIAARFPLAEGAQAHALLESRQVVGKLLLIP
ncbi:MAG TPA: quinone oxidoreductase [Kofleriaceae bacterium]|nr:quinone oxidoreductase [Kofleriaceae bacterium]